MNIYIINKAAYILALITRQEKKIQEKHLKRWFVGTIQFCGMSSGCLKARLHLCLKQTGKTGKVIKYATIYRISLL